MHNPTVLPERFWAKTRESNSGCLIWQAALNNQGYGQFAHEGRTQSAHRLAYMEAKGPIPDGLEIDHLCRVRACVNPDHLEAVTSKVNNQRRVAANPPPKIVHRWTDRWGRQEAEHVAYPYMRRRCPRCRTKTHART